jgi:formylglycine-generating enzyme required for sulfatase activity
MPPGLKFALVAVTVLSSPIFAFGSGFGVARTASRVPAPEPVQLRPGAFSYRVSGEFTRNGRPAVPPIVTIRIERPLSIMRGQVSAADYRRCIEAQACPIADQDATASDLPVVKANWYDANAYAAWLSRETGEHWRLPTDEEWAYAAAGLFKDDVLPESFDGSDPGRRALALYDRDADRTDTIGKALRPVGGFGENENGLLDIAGNVWEWTDTCFARSALNGQGEVSTTTVNCGVRVAEGRHRTYMTDFIRDPRIGGCAVGTPPANLGFRLVRETNSWPGLRLLSSLAQRLFGAHA